MAENLLIVESPSKAKTLKKYLGDSFEILASYGHVRDLVPKTGAVDPTHDFAMQYELIERNQKHVDAIAKAVKNSDHIFLSVYAAPAPPPLPPPLCLRCPCVLPSSLSKLDRLLTLS